MSKTNSGDEQTKSRQAGVRRKQGADQYQPDSDRTTVTGRARSRTRNQPQRVDRTLRTRHDPIGGSIAGGILRQLIVRMESQLAKLDDRITALEQERQELQQERQETEQEKLQLQTLLNTLQQIDSD